MYKLIHIVFYYYTNKKKKTLSDDIHFMFECLIHIYRPALVRYNNFLHCLSSRLYSEECRLWWLIAWHCVAPIQFSLFWLKNWECPEATVMASLRNCWPVQAPLCKCAVETGAAFAIASNSPSPPTPAVCAHHGLCIYFSFLIVCFWQSLGTGWDGSAGQQGPRCSLYHLRMALSS